ncbi:MAG: LytTR family transcriptional regulator [Oscillibacter sp.]|nr:LytTR family transcriptional regulator [Oscillibacter sp.]
MKVEVKLDPALTETKVVIHAPARTAEVEALAERLSVGEELLPGLREDGTAALLRPEDILRFYGEDKAVLAQTAAGTWRVEARLYELEQRLAGRKFVRISHSEIVNLRQVTGLDLKLTGTIRMTLTGGVTTYVSRRYVKRIKEVLGL